MPSPSRPSFSDLPLHPDHPKASAWGLWGPDDELGTLNMLTPELVKSAAAEVQYGEVVALNRPLNVIPMNPSRMACEHKILTKASSNDDELHINTQSSSQWDGLRHYPYQETHLFYNGCTQDDISGPKANLRNGIQHMARRGIAARGVLLDWRRYALLNKIPYSPFSFHAIPLADLKAVAAEQNVTFRPGDILVVRSGFTEEYNRFSAEERNALWQRSERTFVGVDSSEECIRWHWDMGFAAVAGDTVAYEAWPSPKGWGVSLHEVFLSGWGMPIGEIWDLERLSEVCAEKKKWTFFLTSAPLNVDGGVASPPNAIAVL